MSALKGLLPASFVVFALVGPAAAQAPPTTPPPKQTRVQVSVGVPVGFASGEFGDNVDSAAGISASLDVSLGGSIVSVGGEFSHLWYGTESRKVDLGPAIPELAGTFVTVTTDNAMLLVHGRVRVQPHRGRWRPYADGLFGFDYIYTKTSLDEANDCSGSSCGRGIEATNLDDWVPSFGVGAGVMVGLGSSGSTRLDVSVRYLWGGEADYLTHGAIQHVGDTAIFDTSRSRTDIVAVYVGLSFGR
jgi:hypothetical protein